MNKGALMVRDKADERIKVLIVDDDIEAGANLESVLRQTGEPIQIMATVRNTADARRMIDICRPDALFLDIEMPQEDAFHFLERVYPFNFEVIFVTAFDTYAVKAFKLNAIDYILKPLSLIEVKSSVERLKEKLISKKLLRQNGFEYQELLGQMVHRRAPQKVFLKMHGNIVAVDFSDIYFVEAKGSYSDVCFRLKGKDCHVVMTNPIAVYEDLLPSNCFFRIHKSYLINCDHLLSITTEGNKFAELKIGNMLPIGRRRYADLVTFVKNRGGVKN